MSIVMRTLFPSKRRKTDTIIVTETDTESTTTTIQMSASTVSLSGLVTSTPSSSGAHHGHRRQHSTGSYKGLPPHIPRANTRRRESNNNLAGVPPSVSPIPVTKMCTQSNSFLTQPDMRMLLIEAEQRVLYDTLTVIPLRNGHIPSGANLSPCKEFQFLRRKRDTKNLSQMLFGAIPTTTGSESFKIHVLEDEDKILVSKSFVIPRLSKENGSDSDSQSTLRSIDGWRSHITQSTTSTPETFSRVRHISLTFGDEDDLNCGASTAASSMTLPARAFSPPHRLSRNRRRQMAVKTSLSEISSYAIPSSIKSRSRLNSIGSQTDDEQTTSNGRKVALGLLFPASQRFFVFQHMPLIEAEMSRLETRIVTAAGHPPTFLHNITHSWNDFADTVCCLHNAPRLKNPVWLALNEKPNDEQLVSRGFCDQLAQLVRKFDNKESKYFISNVLTAVLMHHMSWVASVASPPLRAERNGRMSKSNELRLFGMPANEDAQQIGYNAQMAQYLEVLGSSGSHKSAKFVICGEDAEELATICQVLSYFIRCSAVQHIDTDKCWELPTEQAFSPVNASDTPDSAASPPSSCNLAFSPPDKVYSDEDPAFGGGHLTHSKSRKARGNSGLLESPSSSVDSLPSVVTHTAIILETGNTSSITIIDRLEYPCCHSSTDEEDEELELWSPRLSSDGLGRSLFAGPLPMYCHHFVVSGLMKNCVDLTSTLVKMYDEVRCNDSPSHRAVGGTPSISSSQSSFSVGESQMPENVLVVADVEDLRVKIVSSDGFDEIASPSEAVVSMLEQFMKMYDYGVQTSCIMSMIEDALTNVVSKSTSLVEIVAGDGKTSHLSPDRVCQILECDYSDLRLIVNVAAVYWPPVLSSFGCTPLPYQ